MSHTAGSNALAAEWLEKNPETPEEILAFYRESDRVGEDIADWHNEGTFRQEITGVICQVAKNNDVKSVLDFGCGQGDDLMALAALEQGIALMGVEVNEPLRSAFLESGLPVVESLEDISPVEKFDMVICIDVLEHLVNPQETVARLLERIPLGGLFIERTSTMDIENPTHLTSNWGWLPNSQIRQAGFTLRQGRWGLNAWQRVAEKAPPSVTLLANIYRSMDLGTVQSIIPLVQRGWPVMFRGGDGLLVRSRSSLVSQWYRESPDDVYLMIDGDIVFHVDDAEHIVEKCRELKGIVCGLYSNRSGDHPTLRQGSGKDITYKKGAEPVEIEYGATGFMAVHRDVIEAMVKTLPPLHPQKPWGFWPFFDLMHKDYELLSEDWAFCERARQHGFKTYVDPSIRLGHQGDKLYRVEDILQGDLIRLMRKDMEGAHEALLGEAVGTADNYLKQALTRSFGLDSPIEEAGITEHYKADRMVSEWPKWVTSQAQEK